MSRDPLFDEILAWAKGVAASRGDGRLDLSHLFLGALSVPAGRELLAEILWSDLPLRPENFLGEMPGASLPAVTPVRDRKFPLSERLREIAAQVLDGEGDLRSEAVLRRVVEELRNDPRWKEVLAAAARQPRTDPARAAQVFPGLIDRIDALRRSLAGRVLGQDPAVERVCDAWFGILQREAAAQHAPGFAQDTRGPRAVFTFVGPPGVGKTLLAEAMARFGSGKGEPELLRIDMSAYAGLQAHERLVGFDTAYKGARAGILTGFAAQHPEGFILFDEVEKAHPHTHHLLLQLLDTGTLYDNLTRRTVDFSRTTVVFTTNLGRELYDSPNRSGVLQQSKDLDAVVLEALGREAQRTVFREAGAGLSPELLSRLAKGAVVLFGRLDGTALERLAERVLRQFSLGLRFSGGLPLEWNDSAVLSLFVLRFGTGGDARRLEASLHRYLQGMVGQVLRHHRGALFEGDDPLVRSLKGFRLCVDRDSLPAPVARRQEGPTRVLLVDDDDWSAVFPEPFRCERAATLEQADEVLRKKGADLVLIDLHIGSGSWQADRSGGLEILRWVRSRFPGVPVYVFSERPEERGLSAELLERVRVEGGARGVLRKAFYGEGHEAVMEREDFFRQLKEVDAELRRQRLVEHYTRRAKVVEFDVEPRFDRLDPDGFLPLQITRVREVTAVSALDREARGWVDLPAERFSDVAGADRAKERLQEVVGWLASPGPLQAMGLDVPRGILLTGPPGTGKTTLARAVAGEAEVPFLAISGSEMHSRWVGGTERNIRELFACARRYAPSVVFIDEIDSLGAARGADRPGWQTSALNELLAQMDGFRQAEQPVFVLAATNRPDCLDPALLRPGRFDLVVEVPLPSAPARLQALELHLSGKPLQEDLDLGAIVDRTAGMSGAEIRQVCQEAGMAALREGSAVIRLEHLNEAVTTVRMGLPAEHVVLDDHARRNTAVHEAGHALAHCLLFGGEVPEQVSILPRGRALGMTELPDPAGRDVTAGVLERRIQVLLAGRAAEAVLLGEAGVTAGAADDLERAWSLAMRAVGEWGLDREAGPLSLPGLREAVSRGCGTSWSGGALHDEAAQRARAWVVECHGAVRSLLESQREALCRLSEALLEHETLYRDELAGVLRRMPGWEETQTPGCHP